VAGTFGASITEPQRLDGTPVAAQAMIVGTQLIKQRIAPRIVTGEG
jgi:hypothetical protein